MIRLALLLLLVPSLCFGSIVAGPGGITFDDDSVQTTATSTATDNKWTLVSSVDQAGITAALSAASGGPVYIPEGTYNISSGISLSSQGQIISGAGVGKTILYAASGFTDDGVLEIGAAYVTIRDMTIRFYQPASFDSRDDLNGYSGGSAGIYASGRSHLNLQNLEVDMAYNGIRLLNNCGGTYVNDVRMTHFNKGIEITNAQDIIRLNGLDFDDADLSSTQLALFKDEETYGLYIERSDTVCVDASRFTCGTGIVLEYNTDGEPQVAVTSCLFEDTRGIEIEYGRCRVNNSVFKLANYAFRGIYQTNDCNDTGETESCGNPYVLVNNCVFLNTYSGALSLDFGKSGSRADVSGCYFYGSQDQDEIYAYASGNYSFTGCLFERSTSRSSAFIEQDSSAQLTIVGCRFVPGGGDALDLGTTTSNHVITGNCFNGWTHDSISSPSVEGNNN